MSRQVVNSGDTTLRRRRKAEILSKETVWVRSGDAGAAFVLGRICELSESGPVVLPLGVGGGVDDEYDERLQPISATYDDVYPAEDDANKDVEDNCGLMYLNEATLLHNVRLRYSRDKIYTYVANILIAVNPYFEIGHLYTRETILSYKGASLGTRPPHVYAIADKAFRDMKVLKRSQSIIVSGESGAGKTESTKYILKYLCLNYGHEAGQLEEKILQANPILEAFGNAKTTRNNNSSRFGKFIEIHFDGQHQVVGGYISHYLLERARVVSQSPQERNYHIFYQLCAGASDELYQRLHLAPPDKFRYLASGCSQYFCHAGESPVPKERMSDAQLKYGSLTDGMLDDKKDFEKVDRDLACIGVTKEERESVYTTIAAILHMGNIQFEEVVDDTNGGCCITEDSEASLAITASLLQLEKDELRASLCTRVMQSKSGSFGTVIMVPLKAGDAGNARDALAKSLYTKLFDFIVSKINQSIPFKESRYYIGVLDIAGFEYFTVNSFEQFCINYCNEKLQQFFNQRILKEEQELYAREGLGVRTVHFVDNQDCIDLIEAKGSANPGIFSLLDEESKLPKPNYQHFTQQVHKHQNGHFRLALPRKSKLKEHRELRDEDGFLIRHFAGAVCYQTKHFIEKNNDALHASLAALVQECQQPFIRALYHQGGEGGGSGDSSGPSRTGKLNFISVASKFQTQLGELIDKLRATGTNFIRCIKPNVRMVAHVFDAASVLSQLQCAGMTTVLDLMQAGFPSRTPFNDLYSGYRSALPPRLACLDPRLFCRALFKALGMSEHDFAFGQSKVFFRPGKFAEFDQLMRSDPEHLKQLVEKVRAWLLRSRWRKVQWCALEVIKLKNKIIYRRDALVKLQTNWRGALARRRHRPRIVGIRRLTALKVQIEQLHELGRANLDAGGQNAVEVADMAVKLETDRQAAIDKVKENPAIKSDAIDLLHRGLVDRINKEIVSAQKRIKEELEEKEKLRKLQEAMEAERRRAEAEAEAKRRAEEERELKSEMERRRRREQEEEEERRLEREERDRNQAEALRKQLEEAEERYAALQRQMEQERRDHELALRLAAESRGGIMNPDDSGRLHEVNLGGGVNNINNNNNISYGGNNYISNGHGAADLRRKSSFETKTSGGKKFDLSKWKYAELRDAINTSCDIELLEACREEFHRRLKVYHAWKAKNRKRNNINCPDNSSNFEENARAPNVILEEAAKCQERGASPCGAKQQHQFDPSSPTQRHRYFRIPFVRPVGAARPDDVSPAGGALSTSGGQNTARGWWYAHFDGPWIGRQMELHDVTVAGENRVQPILLLAGRDDMHMCELNLEETGLTRRRGAEILAREFEDLWSRHGGSAYAAPTGREPVRRRSSANTSPAKARPANGQFSTADAQASLHTE